MKILNSDTKRLICIALYTIRLTFALFKIYKRYHRETLSHPIPPCTKSPYHGSHFVLWHHRYIYTKRNRNVIVDIAHNVNKQVQGKNSNRQNKVVKQRSSPTPAGIIVNIQSQYTYVGIKCPLVYLQVYVAFLVSFLLFLIELLKFLIIPVLVCLFVCLFVCFFCFFLSMIPTYL